MLSKQCKLHLESVNMTGWQHMKHALGIALRLQITVFAVIIHSIAPRWFKTYTSETIRKILDEQPNINK
jgi:hypothetical protein|tara:strand:- start:428 stop:634 length:207 start_codon:yes stop_codon:yes gene_type:complete